MGNNGVQEPVVGFENGQLVGTIATLTLALSVELVAVQSNHPAAPKYEIHARNVAGNKVQMCGQLMHWVYAGGKPVAGLVNRRKAEWRMCMGKGYD